MGNAFGFAPEGPAQPKGKPQRSYTQWEFFFSQGERLDDRIEAPKETFVYFASPEYIAQYPFEQSEQAGQLQQQFVQHILDSGKDWNQFSSLHELRALIRERVGDRRAQLGVASRLEPGRHAHGVPALAAPSEQSHRRSKPQRDPNRTARRPITGRPDEWTGSRARRSTSTGRCCRR